jgi:hypothetical protein
MVRMIASLILVGLLWGDSSNNSLLALRTAARVIEGKRNVLSLSGAYCRMQLQVKLPPKPERTRVFRGDVA